MDYPLLIAILVILAILLVVIFIMGRRRHRTTRLRRRFGSEYDRTLLTLGDAGKAERALAEREARIRALSIHELPSSERSAFAKEWTALQLRFVDDPSIAVNQAELLVTRVMAACGYPVADFEQRADDISVDHPGLVQSYRSARDIMVNHRAGNATTEDLRQAMVYFHSLFDELLRLHDDGFEHKAWFKQAS